MLSPDVRTSGVGRNEDKFSGTSAADCVIKSRLLSQTRRAADVAGLAVAWAKTGAQAATTRINERFSMMRKGRGGKGLGQLGSHCFTGAVVRRSRSGLGGSQTNVEGELDHKACLLQNSRRN